MAHPVFTMALSLLLKVNTQGFLFPRDSSEMTERISMVLRVAIPEWTSEGGAPIFYVSILGPKVDNLKHC